MKRIGGLLLVLALALGAAPVVGVAQTASEAETVFWNRVKDSGKAAELRAYLDAFPNGVYAEQARRRLQALLPSRPITAAPAPPPPPPPRPNLDLQPQPEPGPRTAMPDPAVPPSGGAPAGPSYGTPGTTASVLSDSSIVYEVQERLYNLNYDLALSGRLDEATRKAITAWQANTRRPTTGDMDAEALQALRAVQAPTTWGALAYVARGASSTVWSRSSRGEAERDALEGCRRNGGGRKCQVIATFDSGCGALGWYQGRVRRTTHWGAYAVVRPTLAQAIDVALEECRSQAQTPNQCGIRLQFCADGSHKQ